MIVWHLSKKSPQTLLKWSFLCYEDNHIIFIFTLKYQSRELLFILGEIYNRCARFRHIGNKINQKIAKFLWMHWIHVKRSSGIGQINTCYPLLDNQVFLNQTIHKEYTLSLFDADAYRLYSDWSRRWKALNWTYHQQQIRDFCRGVSSLPDAQYFYPSYIEALTVDLDYIVESIPKLHVI